MKRKTLKGKEMNIPAERFRRKFITKRDGRVQRTPPCWIRWYGAAPRSTKLNPMQGEDQQHCQINFILTLLQRPNFFFHSIIVLLGGPVGYLLLSLPGSPYYLRARPTSCQGCVDSASYTPTPTHTDR